MSSIVQSLLVEGQATGHRGHPAPRLASVLVQGNAHVTSIFHQEQAFRMQLNVDLQLKSKNAMDQAHHPLARSIVFLELGHHGQSAHLIAG
jgi:hypothetical protein